MKKQNNSISISEYKELQRKTKKPRKHDESDLQQSCVKYFDTFYPKLSLNFFKIHNEGNKNIVSAIINKREGLRSGIADLFLAKAKFYYDGELDSNVEFHGLFIELKSLKGTQSSVQKLFQKAVELQDYKYIIIRTLDEFVTEINKYFE